MTRKSILCSASLRISFFLELYWTIIFQGTRGLSVIGIMSPRTKLLATRREHFAGDKMKLLASALGQCHFDYSCSSLFPELDKKKTAVKNCLEIRTTCSC